MSEHWKPQLGERVTVTAGMFKNGPKWECRPLDKPVTGIVTARRTRRNMVQDSDVDEWSGRSYSWWEFGPDAFTGYDVTFSLHRRPIVAKLEHLTPDTTPRVEETRDDE